MSLVLRKQASDNAQTPSPQERADTLVRNTFESFKEASFRELSQAWEQNMIEVLSR